ncbi:MAG: hypothetical protein KJ737_00865 [Proteobacteria bacterium]|nr:hypothetical protein [Pseudomonadota bacterium]
MSGSDYRHARFSEVRSEDDRRKTKPSPFSKYWLYGRRKSIRRKSDRNRRIRLDIHSTELFSVIIFTLILTILDAAFTLLLIGQGAREINPIMAFYLDMGPGFFIFAKYMLTGASILVLLFLKNVYLFKTGFKTRTLIFLAPLPFYLVVQWQFFLILTK